MSITTTCLLLGDIMKTIGKILNLTLLATLLVACNNNHQSEFYRIQRDDIAGYQEFIRKYPNSIYVKDANERIETAKEEKRKREEQERKEAEFRRLESMYGDNSLANVSQPYESWYGRNLYFDDYTPHSEIKVKAPANSDVIVIVRYNNMNGSVAGHRYIRAGMSSTIYLRNQNKYQTFFYYGKGWYPDKEMKNVRGGFIKNEVFSKDGTPSYLDNNILEYELTLQVNGNFSTTSSSEGEMF